MLLPSYEQFKDALHSSFKIDLGEEQDEEVVTMHEITAIRDIGGGFESYSMIFHGPKDRGYLTQNTFRFKHEKIGVFDLFMVPVGETADAFEYQIGVSRPIEEK